MGGSGFGVLAVFFGALSAWCGFNGLNVGTVIQGAMTGKPLPKYTKGGGLVDVAGPVIGYELLKAAMSGGGLSKLGSLLPLKGGGGPNEEPGDTPTDPEGGDPVPADPIPDIPDIPIE